MPKKRAIKIELRAKDEALVHYEMEWGRNESIRRQAAILYYANQGTATQKELCEKTGHDHKTVNRILELYQTSGVQAVYQCSRGKRINHLEQISMRILLRMFLMQSEKSGNIFM
ncbi:MAG: MarR family transcriptional regulator [Oscillospiraceae bacterium]|nr:MarR family transcriptional regulator [Oscillospiraceae bacterium]